MLSDGMSEPTLQSACPRPNARHWHESYLHNPCPSRPRKSSRASRRPSDAVCGVVPEVVVLAAAIVELSIAAAGHHSGTHVLLVCDRRLRGPDSMLWRQDRQMRASLQAALRGRTAQRIWAERVSPA